MVQKDPPLYKRLPILQERNRDDEDEDEKEDEEATMDEHMVGTVRVLEN